MSATSSVELQPFNNLKPTVTNRGYKILWIPLRYLNTFKKRCNITKDRGWYTIRFRIYINFIRHFLNFRPETENGIKRTVKNLRDGSSSFALQKQLLPWGDWNRFVFISLKLGSGFCKIASFQRNAINLVTILTVVLCKTQYFNAGSS